jgi:hypothetical protein
MHLVKHLLRGCWDILVTALCSFLVVVVIGLVLNRETGGVLIALSIFWIIGFIVRGTSIYSKMIATALGDAFESHSDVPTSFSSYVATHELNGHSRVWIIAKGWLRESRENRRDARDWYFRRIRRSSKAHIRPNL